MLKVTTSAGIVLLTLNNPAMGNALSSTMVESLIEQVTTCLANREIHTLELHAEGKHFCTGLDLSALESETDADLLYRLVRIETLLSLLWSAPITTKAFAKGRTWGAGADIVVACEHRIIEIGTSVRFPGAQFGIVLGTARLCARIGTDLAKRLILHGEELSAEQAMHAGLANVWAAEAKNQSLKVSSNTAAAIRAASLRATAINADSDLAALVRSAAEPGLKQRILQYRNQSKAKTPPAPTPLSTP